MTASLFIIAGYHHAPGPGLSNGGTYESGCDHGHSVLGDHCVVQHRGVQHPQQHSRLGNYRSYRATPATRRRVVASLSTTSTPWDETPDQPAPTPDAFQRISHRNRPIASRSDKPQRLQHQHGATTDPGTDGRPLPPYKSANIPSGNTARRCNGQKPVNRSHRNQITTHRHRIQQLRSKRSIPNIPPLSQKRTPTTSITPNLTPNKSAAS